VALYHQRFAFPLIMIAACNEKDQSKYFLEIYIFQKGFFRPIYLFIKAPD